MDINTISEYIQQVIEEKTKEILAEGYREIPSNDNNRLFSKPIFRNCSTGEVMIDRKSISPNPAYNFDYIIERGSSHGNEQPFIISSYQIETTIDSKDIRIRPAEMKILKGTKEYEVYLKGKNLPEPGIQE